VRRSLEIAFAAAGLAACDVSSIVGYNEGALGLEACPPESSIRACSSGACVVTELAEAEMGVETVGVDAESVYFLTSRTALARHVYWTEYGNFVRRVPKAGGATADVTEVFGHPKSIAVDAEHVYFVVADTGEIAMAPIPPARRRASEGRLRPRRSRSTPSM
jgi:hypothetical protein